MTTATVTAIAANTTACTANQGTAKAQPTANVQGVEVRLVKVGSINAELRKVEHKKLAVTISALYHAVIFGNVSFMDSWKRTDATLLDATLRALFPVRYHKDKYTFNADKAKAVQEQLGVTFQIATFEEFAAKVLAYHAASSNKVKAKELDAAAIGASLNKSAIALIKKFQANGVSLDALKTAIVLAEKGELK